jgi:hypothetical protein
MQRNNVSQPPSTASYRRRFGVTSLAILTSVVGVAACSSDSGLPVDGGPIWEAGSDVTPDVTSLDGNPDVDAAQACSPQTIWPHDGEGFTYSQSGGFVAPPPPDAGCSGVFVTYQFSVAAMTLSKHACNALGPIDLTVHLTQTQALQIVMSLQGLKTSCPVQNCGADYPDVVLTVLATATQPMAYSSDFYAGCGGAVLPPFVSYQSLDAFSALLGSIVTSACQPGGGGADTRICTQGQTDGGSDGGGADARACSGTAPNCFGNNASMCCGNDPSGQAVCSGGAWMCDSAPAPGCNGISCLLPQDAGNDARPQDTGPG